MKFLEMKERRKRSCISLFLISLFLITSILHDVKHHAERREKNETANASFESINKLVLLRGSGLSQI